MQEVLLGKFNKWFVYFFFYIIPNAVHLKNTEGTNNILHPEWLYNKRCSGFNEDKLLEQTNTAMSQKKFKQRLSLNRNTSDFFSSSTMSETDKFKSTK